VLRTARCPAHWAGAFLPSASRWVSMSLGIFALALALG
jgi:hypothetical protein